MSNISSRGIPLARAQGKNKSQVANVQKSIPEKVKEVDWQAEKPYISIQEFRWSSDAGMLYVEHRPDSGKEYELKYLEDRFKPDTLAEGQEDVARTVDRILG